MAETITVTIDKNDTGAERRCNYGYRLVGIGCGYDLEYFKQGYVEPEPSGCTDCYVAFENSRTVTMDASGGTLNNEGIVQHGNGTNCDVEVKNFTITSTDGNTSGISVSPSSGDITSCNITVPENTSTSDRTIVITIHPNIDERSTDNCKN